MQQIALTVATIVLLFFAAIGLDQFVTPIPGFGDECLYTQLPCNPNPTELVTTDENTPIPELTTAGPTSELTATVEPTPELTATTEPTSAPSTPVSQDLSKRDFSTEDSAINTLLNKRSLRVAYSYEAGPFSFNKSDDGVSTLSKDGIPDGLEPRMVKEFVKRVFGFSSDEEAGEVIEWIPIREIERIDRATDHDIDFVIGAISDTSERCNNQTRVCTDVHHWKDNAAILVRRRSNVDGFCSLELENQNIAVINNTTNESASSDGFAKCAKEIQYGARIGYRTRKLALDALLSENDPDKVIGYVSDYWLLEFYLDHPEYVNRFKVVGRDRVDQVELYVFIMKKENSGLRDLLTRQIEEIRDETFWNDWLEDFGLE